MFGDADRAALRAAGWRLAAPRHVPATPTEIGELIAWVCANADGLYLGAGWRRCPVSRALRAAAVACGLTLAGYA